TNEYSIHDATISEQQLCADLELPPAGHAENTANLRWHADVRTRSRQVRMVRCIESFAAKLQIDLLGDLQVLEQSGIDVYTARGKQDIPSAVAVCERRGHHEGARIEPSFARRVVHFAIADPVGAAARPTGS